jgi:hypothetical protein
MVPFRLSRYSKVKNVQSLLSRNFGTSIIASLANVEKLEESGLICPPTMMGPISTSRRLAMDPSERIPWPHGLD